ncbi:MAG: thioredoxin domain-containing protein [Candidatus Hydrothermarchaeaceae archaeon]
MTEHLLDFYGTECGICKEMDPLVERLEEELGVKVRRIEIWHNQDNAKLFMEYDQGRCGSVPFFYNVKTKKWVCGKATYEKLVEWAQG